MKRSTKARPLRIGIEGHVLGRRATGNERVISGLAPALRDLGEHDLVLYMTDKQAAEEWKATFTSPTSRVEILRHANRFARLSLGLGLAAKRDRLDVLLVHANRPLFAPCPLVSIVHDISFEEFPQYFSPFERLYLRRTIPWTIRTVDRVITCSAFTRDEIVHTYKVSPDRLDVVHWGVDPFFFGPSEVQTPILGPYFLAIGNLQPRKNLITLIRGYSDAVRQDPSMAERLVLVGQDRYGSREIRKEATALVDEGRILFTGYVDDEKLLGLLQGATAFVYPSIYEGFGFPPLEAMAAGTPVLVSDIPAMREVVGDGGRRLPPSDLGAWSTALRELAGDGNMREEMARRGAERVRGFTWDRTARAVSDVLESVGRARRPG